jgi:hypothetical protein
MKKQLVFAVDFDGTLCNYAFPLIGKQTDHQIKLLNLLIKLQKRNHKIVLWTNRGDNEAYKSLSEAIEWCKSKGLVFDAINENVEGTFKLSGYSPKIMADYYIDDKALNFADEYNRENTINLIERILEE